MLMKQLTGGTVGGGSLGTPVESIICFTLSGYYCTATDDTTYTIDASSGWTGDYLKLTPLGSHTFVATAVQACNVAYKDEKGLWQSGHFNANDQIFTYTYSSSTNGDFAAAIAFA